MRHLLPLLGRALRGGDGDDDRHPHEQAPDPEGMRLPGSHNLFCPLLLLKSSPFYERTKSFCNCVKWSSFLEHWLKNVVKIDFRVRLKRAPASRPTWTRVITLCTIMIVSILAKIRGRP